MDKDSFILSKDEFVVAIDDIIIYEFKSLREARTYIRGRVKLEVQEVLTRDFRKLINSDTE